MAFPGDESVDREDGFAPDRLNFARLWRLICLSKVVPRGDLMGTIWAVVSALGLLFFVASGATPTVRDGHVSYCSGQHENVLKKSEAPAEHPPVFRSGYLVAVRMGWAPG